MLPESWRGVLGEEPAKPYFTELMDFVEAERAAGPVYPPREDVFAALEATPYDRVKVLVLGQDPYHGAGQGHGLCFSVRPGVKTPPSLRNIYKELREDLGHPVPDNGCLLPWAEQGVLLLNRVLTVEPGNPGSHRDKGWEKVTEQAIRALVDRDGEPLVAILWGRDARNLAPLLVDVPLVESAHPSPMSADRGFFGSKPFSRANELLADLGGDPVDWKLP
ncbi:MAG TPA: uracil-DNA glycosylase [Streptomyces sp.]|nr:uracil-DNA glycosylase [Streptomyces sp.]